MFDANKVKLKAGDIVMCIDEIPGCIKNGDYYTVVEILDSVGRISVNPDLRGLEGHYLSRRFIKVNDHGDQVVS